MELVVVMPVGVKRGGAETSLMDLLRETRTSISWTVVFLEPGPMVQAAADLGVAVVVAKAGRARHLHRTATVIAKVAWIARRKKAAAIIGWTTKAHLYSGPASVLARVPAIWYQVGPPNPHGPLERVAMAMPAAGILTNSLWVDAAQARLWPPRRRRIVQPGVDLDRFEPSNLPTTAEVRKRLSLPESGPIIGIFGRLQRFKGMHVLVAAMPEIVRSFPDALCVIVGGEVATEAGYATELRRDAELLGLSDRVVITGHKDNVEEWMQAVDVVVHASDAEPFGLVVIEAMALGKPVVAGDQGGPAEIITPGVNGLLAPYGDSMALAAAVLTYLRNPEKALQMGSAAKTRAADFSSRTFAATLMSAVAELVSTTT